MFVIQILDDADVAFCILGAELRTVLSATTMLADKPHRLNGRTIAQRFSAMALNGHAGMSAKRSLLGAKRTWHGSAKIDAIDPTETSAAPNRPVPEVDFRPYQSTRLSRYDAAS